MRPFRNVDDTLGVIYTHGFAGLAGGLLLGFFADPNIIVYAATGGGVPTCPASRAYSTEATPSSSRTSSSPASG